MSKAKRALGLPRHPKERGEVAEVLFAAKAASLGFTILQPLGQSRPYDLVVEFDGKLTRVQVKSSWRLGQYRAYHFPVGTWHRRYRAKDVDIIAAYVAPRRTWYIIPLRAILPRRNVRIAEKEEISRYWKYREAWEVLTGNW